MASFRITTPLISNVLSGFMACLALGSWMGGSTGRHLANQPASLFVRLYGSAELIIRISGLAVLPLLRWSHGLLLGQGGSTGYYLVYAA